MKTLLFRRVATAAGSLVAAIGLLLPTVTAGTPVATTSPATVVTTTGSITTLRADPTRVRVYGIVQDGVNAGSVFAYDPIAGKVVAKIPVGKRPADLAVKPDGTELLVICSVDQTIQTISLASLKVTGTIKLPVFENWGEPQTLAHVCYGPGSTIYYTDGAWPPVLRVLDRSTKTVRQTLSIGYTGVGEMALSPDQTKLYAWAQAGWYLGNSFTTSVARFTVDGTGLLTLESQTGTTGGPNPTLASMTSPVLIGADGERVMVGNQIYTSGEFPAALGSLASSACAISPGGEVASTASGVYATETGSSLYTLPAAAGVQAITADYSRLVYVDSLGQSIAAINLNQVVSWGSLGLGQLPASKAVTMPPAWLRWAPVEGAVRYRVYLGSTSAAVGAATTKSSEYLGETTLLKEKVSRTLAAGTTYYWRVDAVKSNDTVTKGAVTSFKVTALRVDQTKLTAATVPLDPGQVRTLSLSSAKSGLAWTAKASATWIKLGAASGKTPAKLTATLDPRKLSAGVHRGTISLTSSDGTLVVPVELKVEPFHATLMRSAPKTTKVYVISEGTDAGAGAYLLEVDTLTKTVTRVVPVGSSVTDLAIHRGDNRIYVTNWSNGILGALSLTTLAPIRTYAFTGTSLSTYTYTDNDVYRIAAGKKGRLVVESKNSRMRVLDTGTAVLTQGNWGYQGGGAFDPTGRYYYHGDSNSSGAAVHRFDLNTDTFVDLDSVRVSDLSYYGSDWVVMAESGQRVFWNGGVFSPELALQWQTAQEIRCASADGRYAFGQSRIYDVVLRKDIAAMPASTTVSAYNSSTGRIVVQKGSALSITSPVGPGLIGASGAPANQATVLAPTQLRWTAIPGVSRYRVYFGISSSAVTAAGTGSTEYRGEVSGTSFTLNQKLTEGTTYYWRIDPVTADGVVIAGTVVSFTVAPVATSTLLIEGRTVTGDPGYKASLPLTTAQAGSAWTASASASWVKLSATSGTGPATLAVTLDASALTQTTNQASITIRSGTVSVTVPVRLQLDPLAITAFQSDPSTSFVYALSEPSVQDANIQTNAYLLKIDALTQKIVAAAAAGSSATSLAVHPGDNRVYVVNYRTGRLLAFDRGTLALRRTYTNFRAPNEYSGSGPGVRWVVPGKAGRLVVSDGGNYIVLFDTVNAKVLDTAYAYGAVGRCDAAGRYYYTGSYWGAVYRYDLSADNLDTVITSSSSDTYGDVTNLTADGSHLFVGRGMFTSDLQRVASFAETVNCINADGSYAFGTQSIYETLRQQVVKPMPVATAISAFNTATGRLVVKTAAGYAFSSPVGPGLLGAGASPAPGAVVTPPARLTWSAIPGAQGYRIYLGTSSDDVAAASTDSATYLGETTSASIALPTLTTGTKYFWRVDIIAADGTVVKGDEVSFTASDILPDAATIEATTVQGDPGYTASLGLSSATAGLAWSASSSESWVRIGEASGTTPATLHITLDATELPPGLNTATISVTTPTGSFTVPVKLLVDALHVNRLEAEPGTSRVFALSEVPDDYAVTRAYLLELDALRSRVRRAVPAGTAARDLAIHPGDRRIYVTNQKTKSILAFSLDTLARVQTYTTVGDDALWYEDVLLSPGRAGRLLLEGREALLWDTAAGTELARLDSGSSGGACDPAGTYYYRAASYSNRITRYRIDQDTFAEAIVVDTNTTHYDRRLIISEDGTRLFSGQMVFDAGLREKWRFPESIYATDATGQHAFGVNLVYATDTGREESGLTGASQAMAFNSVAGKLVYQKDGGFVFTEPVDAGWTVAATPGPDHVVNTPAQLTWPALGEAVAYHVYLGTSEADVAVADTASALYLGEVNSPACDVSARTFAAGTTYYWRVDIVRADDVAPGPVLAFRVAEVAPDVPAIDARTVQGDPALATSLTLKSATPGVGWTATASKSWVKLRESSGTTPATLHIELDATSLPADLSQATITITSAGGSCAVPVNLELDPLNVILLRSARQSTHAYAVSMASSSGGLAAAYLLDLDTLTKTVVRVVPAGASVTALAVHEGDGCVYLSNWELGRILAFDLATLAPTRTYDVDAGQSNYSYSDDQIPTDAYGLAAAAAGRLVVENYGGVAHLINTITGDTLAKVSIGRGIGRCDPSGSYYYHGVWYGSTNSLERYSLAGDVFTEAGTGGNSDYVSSSSVRNAGLLISDDGQRLVWGSNVYSAALERESPLPFTPYGLSSDGRYIFGQSQIYDTRAEQIARTMPVQTVVSAWNGVTGRLICQNGSAFSFTAPVGPGLLGAASPANGAVTNAVTHLTWNTLPGVSGYRVYLGTSAGEVSSATTASALYLGEVSEATIALPHSLVAGLTYYWRVDVVVDGDTIIPGDVVHFTLSDVIPDTMAIDAATVQGDPACAASIALTSSTAGASWSASVSAGWVHLSAKSGTTPATLGVTLDTSGMSAGTKTAAITISAPTGTYSLPVKLTVESLNVTVLHSDPASTHVYALTEVEANSSDSRAYLIETDARTKKILRVVRAGRSATDLAVHHGDKRIYVVNQDDEKLLAFDLSSLKAVKTYPLSTNNETSRISHLCAGPKGRLVLEPQDHFSNVLLFSTTTGATLASQFHYQGGGATDASGRYYYLAPDYWPKSVAKYDLASDTFRQVATLSFGEGDAYYGGLRVAFADGGTRGVLGPWAFDTQMKSSYYTGTLLVAMSGDGRVAFSSDAAYDVVRHRVIPGYGAIGTSIAACNGTAGVLVYQKGTAFAFTSVASPALKLSAIGTQSIQEDQSTSALKFTVSEPGFDVAAVSVTATSSNTKLVPPSGLIVRGSGANRTITVKPASNQNGSATITLTARDGAEVASTHFTLKVGSVNDRPSLTTLKSRTIPVNGTTGAIALKIGDVETPVSALKLSARSTNAALVPASAIVFGGSGANRTVTIKPVAGRTGASGITLSVSDGQAVTSTYFVLTVASANRLPTISSVANLTLSEDAPPTTVRFTVADTEAPASLLAVTGASSNAALLPASALTLGGSGANRTLQLKPMPNAHGSARITLTVSDGEHVSSRAFTVTVRSVNDVPAVTAIANQTIDEDASTAVLPFTIGDVETPASALKISASSSNAALVSAGGIALGGTGANRTIRITPAANRNGAARITLSVSDGAATTPRSFVLTVRSVNDAPTISAITNQTIVENGATATLPFTIGDAETPASGLTVTAVTSNASVIAASGLALSGTGASRTVRVAPLAGKYGVGYITLTVSDGSLTASRTFAVTVNPLPKIASVGPTRQVIAPAAAGTLAVSATGTGVLNYQWFHNGRALLGATASEYSVNSAGVADGGFYWVDVSDSIGTRRSPACFVLVAPATTEVLAWGGTASGVHSVPLDLTDAVALAGGTSHALAIRAGGTVAAWGSDANGQTDVPIGLTDVVAVAAGTAHSLALKSDGTVVAWGANTAGQASVPAGLAHVVAIAAGGDQSFALRSDGTVTAWGDDSFGALTAARAASSIAGLAAGASHAIAVKSDGTALAWGSDFVGETELPSGLTGLTAVAAAGQHSLALKSDGTVVAWGDNTAGQSAVPTGLSGVVALAAGPSHTLVLKSDGSVVAWGDDSSGAIDVPVELGAVWAIAGGSDFSLALWDATAAP